MERTASAWRDSMYVSESLRVALSPAARKVGLRGPNGTAGKHIRWLWWVPSFSASHRGATRVGPVEQRATSSQIAEQIRKQALAVRWVVKVARGGVAVSGWRWRCPECRRPAGGRGPCAHCGARGDAAGAKNAVLGCRGNGVGQGDARIAGRSLRLLGGDCIVLALREPAVPERIALPTADGAR